MGIIDEEGLFKSIPSFDFCDKTTWWQKSTQVTGEIISSESSLLYAGANNYWIDLEHGKVTGEDTVSSTYKPKIYIDNVLQTSGYSINYATGKITFDSPPSGQVKADYYYAGSSEYILAPDPGTCLIVRRAEIQFCLDVQMNEVSFDVYGYNPYDLPNKISYDNVKYKNIKDILNISNTAYYLPQMSGFADGLVIFPFNYNRSIFLYSSKGMEIRLRIKDDVPFAGSFATCTFYCVEEKE